MRGVSGRSREVAKAAERFGADMAVRLSVGSCVSWRSRIAAPRPSPPEATCSVSGRRPVAATGLVDEALRLLAGPECGRPERSIEDRVEARLTERHAVFQECDLRSVVLEQTAGRCTG